MIGTLGRLVALPLIGLQLLLQALAAVCGVMFVALAGICLLIAGRSGLFQPPPQL